MYHPYLIGDAKPEELLEKAKAGQTNLILISDFLAHNLVMRSLMWYPQSAYLFVGILLLVYTYLNEICTVNI